MRVDDTERTRLLAQVNQHTRQHDVLEHIREIAGMESVAIVQATGPGCISALYRLRMIFSENRSHFSGSCAL
jgi:hypothetical protein